MQSQRINELELKLSHREKEIDERIRAEWERLEKYRQKLEEREKCLDDERRQFRREKSEEEAKFHNQMTEERQDMRKKLEEEFNDKLKTQAALLRKEGELAMKERVGQT